MLASTNIIHPHEGLISLGLIPTDAQADVVEAFRELLHGEETSGARMETLVGRLQLPQKDGSFKAITWPMATLLGALYRPDEDVAVKPTFFASQARVIGLSPQGTQPVSEAAYARHLEVARVTRDRLVEAGHAPKDLMDVYAFIWRSHSEKPGKTAPASAAGAGT